MRVDEASRYVHAAPDRVLEAFAVPEVLASWLPPRGMDGHLEDADLRAGEGFRTVLVYREPHDSPGKATADSDVAETRIVALEPGRVVWQVEFVSDDPRNAGTMTMTWTIAAQASGSLVSVRASDVPEGIDPGDHVAGLSASLENLGALLAEG